MLEAHCAPQAPTQPPEGRERGAAERESSAEPDAMQSLGRKILLYVLYCCTGRDMSADTLSPERALIAKSDVYSVIFSRYELPLPGEVRKSTIDLSETPEYPYLRTLLHFDTSETLRVLSLTFEDPALDTAASDIRRFPIPDRQLMVDILVDCVGLGASPSPRHQFSDSQKGRLYLFIARQLVAHRAYINVSAALLDQLIRWLTNAYQSVLRVEREDAVVALFRAQLLYDFPEATLLMLAEHARFVAPLRELLARAPAAGRALQLTTAPGRAALRQILSCPRAGVPSAA